MAAAWLAGAWADRPWPAGVIVLALSAFGWWQLWGWFRYDPNVTLDAATREASLAKTRDGQPVRVEFDEVADVRVDSFWRSRKGRLIYGRIREAKSVPVAVYPCHELTFDLADGRRLSVIEDADEEAVRAVADAATTLLARV